MTMMAFAIFESDEHFFRTDWKLPFIFMSTVLSISKVIMNFHKRKKLILTISQRQSHFSTVLLRVNSIIQKETFFSFWHRLSFLHLILNNGMKVILLFFNDFIFINTIKHIALFHMGDGIFFQQKGILLFDFWIVMKCVRHRKHISKTKNTCNFI